MYYPTTFVDNVFENPDAVREYALQQEYNTDNIHTDYPGVRSRPIAELNSRLDKQIISTILNQYYDLQTTDVNAIWSSYFQIVPKENSDTGLIHRDHKVTLSAITYLNKEVSGWGTSLWHPTKVDPLDNVSEEYIAEKFKTKNDTSWNDFIEEKKSYYKQILSVDNVYNNMIIFSGHRAHKADLHNPVASEDRLTIVTFIDSIIGPEIPWLRAKKFNSYI